MVIIVILYYILQFISRAYDPRIAEKIAKQNDNLSIISKQQRTYQKQPIRRQKRQDSSQEFVGTSFKMHLTITPFYY